MQLQISLSVNVSGLWPKLRLKVQSFRMSFWAAEAGSGANLAAGS